jgi:hypothetical protein
MKCHLLFGLFTSLPLFVVEAAKPWMDCSGFFMSSRSNSYFVPSSILENYFGKTLYGDYSSNFDGCKGAVTANTRLARVKDSELAKDLTYWINYYGYGDYQNYIALNQTEDSSSVSSNWFWSDGTSAPVSSTYWADGEPSGGSCASLYGYGSWEGKLSSVQCNETLSSICEIPGMIDFFLNYLMDCLQILKTFNVLDVPWVPCLMLLEYVLCVPKEDTLVML